MLIRILALLGGAVLLSLGLSHWFDFSILAAIAFMASIIKKSLPALLLFGRRWVTNLFIRILPQKLALFLARRGLISKLAERKISGNIALQKQRVSNRFSFWRALGFLVRATILMALMGGILLASFFWLNLGILLVWLPRELEALLQPIWRFVTGWLANSTLFRGIRRFYVYLTGTRIGKSIAAALTWCDRTFAEPVAVTGASWRKRWLPRLDPYLESLPTTDIRVPKAPRQKPARSPFAAPDHKTKKDGHPRYDTQLLLTASRKRTASRIRRR